MYSKLDSSPDVRQIRLLHLHPGAWEDSIHCSLEVVSLSSKPRFKALSYVWGDVRKTKPITVDGQPFTATLNLAEGLQRIRDPIQPLTLFVDAVCINQADMDERGLQVQLMGEIYSSAEEVLVWLGYCRDVKAPVEEPRIYDFTGEGLGMDVVEECFERFLSQSGEDEWIEATQRPHDIQGEEGGKGKGAGAEPAEKVYDSEDVVLGFSFLRLTANNIHFYDMPFLQSNGKELLAVHNKTWRNILHDLGSFETVPWWTRVWTYQEIVLASEATLFYHNVTIPWEMVTTAVLALRAHYDTCCSDAIQGVHQDFLDTLVSLHMTICEGIVALRERIIRQKFKPNLRQLLTLTRWRNATNPLDKVYGVLGLLPVENNAQNLHPNYALSPSQLLMSASVNDMKLFGGLRTLMGTPRLDIPSSPTWVTEDTTSNAWHMRQWTRITCAFTFFRASGPTESAFALTGDVLSLTGFGPIDRIVHVGVTMFENADWSVDGLSIKYGEAINMWWELAGIENRHNDQYSGNQTWAEAFWRTIANDIIAPNNKHRRLDNTIVPGIPEKEWAVGFDQLSADESATYAVFEESCKTSCSLRRFFVTENGRMGIGPPSIAPGDDIVIFCGGNVPFCVRREPDWTESRQFFTLVGDVYLHGVMDGEAVPGNWKRAARHLFRKWSCLTLPDKVVQIHLR